MSARPTPEALVVALCVTVGVAVTATLTHAAIAASRRPALDARALVRTVGFSDLALSSGARWLRHPTQVEPWAARSDEPGGFDVEPAGALLHPRTGDRP